MEDEANKLIDPLYNQIDEGMALDNYDQGIFDVINWLYHRGDKPELSDY